MAHIPYASEQDEENAAIVAAIRARRGGRLLNLDRMLLHWPAVAQGWGALMGPIRNGARIEPRHRELAISAVAALTGADYEFGHHAAELTAAGGSAAQVAALTDVAAASADERLFDRTERVILRVALESTGDVGLNPGTLAALRAEFPEPEQVFELVMTVAAYNMVSRLLVGLGVDLET
jgi:alkylhydroperoxidase family enzyme